MRVGDIVRDTYVKINFMTKYQIRPEIDKEARKELSEHSDIVAHLLFHRGITTKSEADSFFSHIYENLHDPFLLKDMNKAVKRILDAISKQEMICIYSDYDADGIPAAVILSDFFDKINYKNYFVYIPHRNKEGFGLNNKALEIIKDRDVTLLITLDCGIADVEQVSYAKSLDIDIVITDHHETGSVVPDAFAIINPKQKSCEYPEKMLCGSAVSFKLVQALLKKGDFNISKNWEKTLLDMVGIATLSDMVPLKGENRTLAIFGLTVLRMSQRKGLHLLLKKNRIDQNKISEDDVGFTISPRINAASRMDEPEMAFKMLKARNYTDAGALVDHLQKINDTRKGHVAVMVKEARRKLKDSEPSDIIVLGNTKWQPSLLGLAANTLSGDFNKPVFLWVRGEGTDLKGSCRSPHISVVDLLSKLPDTIIETWGGHHQAGGFVVRKDAVDFLKDELLKINDTLKQQALPEDFVDKALSLGDINSELWNNLEKLAPFGVGNHRPLFLFNNVIVDSLKQFGKRNEHLSLQLKENPLIRKNTENSQNINLIIDSVNSSVTNNANNKTCEAIAFFKSTDSWKKNIKEKESINIIATIEKNNFGNSRGVLRLRIVDVV